MSFLHIVKYVKYECNAIKGAAPGLGYISIYIPAEQILSSI